MQNGLGGPGRTNHNVGLGHRRQAFVKADGSPAKLVSQVERPVVGAVGHEHGACAFLREMADAGLAHLARADDHHRLPGQVAVENALGQIDSDAADGSRAPADAGLGPNLLRDLEGRLEKPVGHPPSQFGLLGGLVSLFHLAGDFGLANNHRIQTAGYGEQSAERLRPLP